MRNKIKIKNTLIIAVEADSQHDVIAAEILKVCESYSVIKKMWLSIIDEKSADKSISEMIGASSEVPKNCQCPNCYKPLRRIKSQKSNSFFWGCSGYPDCRFSTDDENNSPKLDVGEHKQNNNPKRKQRKETIPPNHQAVWVVSGELGELMKKNGNGVP